MKPSWKIPGLLCREQRAARAIRSVNYSALRQAARKDEGSLVVETALALLVVVPIVFWLFELCMLVYTYSVLGDAARQGVRYAIVHGTDSTNCSGPSSGCGDSTGSNVSSVVKNAAAYSFHNLSNMSVQVTYPDSSSTPSSRIAVAIDYNYVPYVNLPGIATRLQLQAQGRIVY